MGHIKQPSKLKLIVDTEIFTPKMEQSIKGFIKKSRSHGKDFRKFKGD